MTITELITNFRSALIGLLPRVEKVQIPWRRLEAYDEWDDLVKAIYQALVVQVIRWGIPEPDRNHFKLPPYDMVIPSYAQLSVIEVVADQGPVGLRVFHSLQTSRDPFDTVESRLISEDGTPLSDSLESILFSTARFRLRLASVSKRVILFDHVILNS